MPSIVPSNQRYLPEEVSQKGYFGETLAKDLADLAVGTTVLEKPDGRKGSYGAVGDWQDNMSWPPRSQAENPRATAGEMSLNSTPQFLGNQRERQSADDTRETTLEIIAPIPVVLINIGSFEFQAVFSSEAGGSSRPPTVGSVHEDVTNENQLTEYRATSTRGRQLHGDRDAFTYLAF